MSPNTKNRLKAVDISSIEKRKAELEKEFNQKRDEFVQKEKEWVEYNQKMNTDLIKLQGAYESLTLLLSQTKSARK